MKAKLRDVIIGEGGITYLTFEVREKAANFYKFLTKIVELIVEEPKKNRSLSANGLYWACIGDLCHSLRISKDECHIMMLRRYGVFQTLRMTHAAYETFKGHWRDTEVIEEGDDYVDFHCYFSSSTYTSKEFSVLIDGVISEMKEVGLTPPPDEKTKAIIEHMEKEENDRLEKERQKQQEEGG